MINKRMLIMLPFLLAAAWLALFGDKTPSGGGEVVAPIAAAARVAQSDTEAPVENPAITGEADSNQVRRLRDRVNLGELENGPKVDLFSAQGGSPNPAPVAEAQPQPPPPPTQPFVLVGRMYDQDHWVAFLESQGRTHVVQAGEVVDGFRIDAVSGREIRLTQLVDKSKFVIPVDGEKKDSAHD